MTPKPTELAGKSAWVDCLQCKGVPIPDDGTGPRVCSLCRGRGWFFAGDVYDQVIEGMRIFSRYEHVQALDAQHDMLFAGPPASGVSADHRAMLEALGWWFSEEHDGFWRGT